LYPSPVAIADVTTTTTHKTLRGPRGGMILAPRRSELTERIDAAVFPGTQGGPLMHVIAAKAVAFAEALEPKFAAYQRQTLANARLMAKVFIERGYRIMTGGTDNHMLLVDLRGTRVDAAQAERALHAAHIAVNRASLPGDTGSEPTQGDGGLRLGTPAVTTRGFREPEIRILTGWIADILDAGGAEPVVARVRAEVVEMCASFPVYGAQ
jgi:glycine hydroxymethyltransferase